MKLNSTLNKNDVFCFEKHLKPVSKRAQVILFIVTFTLFFNIPAQSQIPPPVGCGFNCPENVTVSADSGECSAANVNLVAPLFSEDCTVQGNALDFDGLENGITVPDFTPLLLETFQVTISAWVNPRVENVSIPELQFLQDAIELNTWQHVALTFDASILNVYLNGNHLGSVQLNVPLLNLIEQLESGEVVGDIDIDVEDSGDLDIGINELEQILLDSFPLASGAGTIDEVQIWNVIRTQEQIQLDMNSERSAQPGLIALYHFNEGVAGGDNTGVTTAFDSSGNDFHITLNDFSLTGSVSNWVEGKSFSGYAITNDVPVAYNPDAFDFGSNAEATVTVNGPNVAVFPVGDTTVTWTARDASGSFTICTQTVTVEGFAHTWTGASDTNWENAANWDNAPTLSVIGGITLPAGLSNYPVLEAGQNLNINACSNVAIESGASLTVSPNAVVTNNGVVRNSGVLAFESDASGSAYIGESSGAFVGDATIERFIPARRAFRLISSPVTTDDYISNNWQLATHITGSSSGANGFDQTNTGNASMYGYNNVNQAWFRIPNTDATNLESGVPYRLFVRGDRTIDLTDNFATPSPTTLMATGELTAENNEPAPVALNATAGGFSFVGNPFQAQVNMEAVLNEGSNVNTTFFWVWDPNLGSRGAYATVIVPTGAATAGAQNQYLQAGQACFVRTNTASAASIVFSQDNKNTNDTETPVFKTSGKNSATGQLNLKLYESAAYAESLPAADGVWVFFDEEGNNDVDNLDAIDFSNLDENFSTNNNGTLLSVENRATPAVGDEIQLEVNTYRATDYVLEATASALQGDTPFLVDTYLNQSVQLEQNETTTYAYSIDTSIADSFAGDRFKIIFQKALSVSERDLSNIVLYPNPSNSGQVYLNIPQGVNDLDVTIYNALGAKVYQSKVLATGNKIEVNARTIKNDGIYFVKFSSEGLTTTKKLIIN